MKKRRAQGTFLEQLKAAVRSLKSMKPGQVHVLSVNANYGRYQLVIGPAQGDKKSHGMQRPIEINGEIHHLFVSPRSVRANPTRQQMMENLKDTIIMRNLSIHLVDPEGDGHHLAQEKMDERIHAKEYINLAGSDGNLLAHSMGHDRRLTMAAYHIVQEDILRSLKEHGED